MNKPKIVCIFPPGFERGAMAVGASAALFEENLRPELIVGNSGGAIAAASVAGWDREVIGRSLKIWSALTPKQISRIRLADGTLVASLLISSLLHVVPEFSRGRWRYLEKAAKGLISFGLLAGSLKAFFGQMSLLSPAPLAETLRKNLSLQKIFASATKLIIVSAKYVDGERVIYTNFLEEDRREPARLVEGLLESSATTPLFPPRGMAINELKVDGIFAHEDCLGLDLVGKYAADCDCVLVFLFYGLPKVNKPDSWLEVNEHTNELMVRDKIEDLLSKDDPQLPEEIRRIRKKIIVVKLEEQPERIGLRDFSKEDARRMIELGCSTTKRVLKEQGWTK